MEFNRSQIVTMEQMLPIINKKFITLRQEEKTKNSEILTNILGQLKATMKEVDPFFRAYASQIDYSGSYYDGLKVGSPNEYDMNVIIKLPINYNDIEIENSPKPGYVKLKIIKAFDDLKKQPNWETVNKVTHNWLDGKKYLKQSNFRNWMESVVNKALNKLGQSNGGRSVIYISEIPYGISVKKSGPAMTFIITQPLSYKIEVDFVPVLQFSAPQWPLGKKTRRMEDCEKKQWFAVPKPLKEGSVIHVADNCWRTHFKEQENYFLHNKNNFKTALRLMKKMRDNTNLRLIASYYIKTLFLWELGDNNETLLTRPLSIIFLTMLEKLQFALQTKRLPYFWNKNLNLLESIHSTTLSQYSNIINFHLKGIKANSSLLMDLLLSEEEKLEYHISERLTLSDPENDDFNAQPREQVLQENTGQGLWMPIAAIFAGMVFTNFVGRNRNNRQQ